MDTEDAPPMEPADLDSGNPSGQFKNAQPVAAGRPGSTKRKSGGGVRAVLSHLIPVVLGGVMVFGVYFLFLDDWLKSQKPTEPNTDPPPKNSDDSSRENATVPPPQPTFAPPGQTNDLSSPVITQPQNPASLQTKREDDAANALRLAERMLEIRPPAAESWYRKVVEKYPNTKAGRKASDWLKRQGREP